MTAVAGLLELQRGLFNVLSAYTPLQDLIGNPPRVYDVPPPDATYPFLSLARKTSQQWGARDITGSDLEWSIFAYANSNRGLADVTLLGDLVRLALDNQDIPLAAGTVILCQFSGTDDAETNDGVTWMGTTKFRILLQTT